MSNEFNRRHTATVASPAQEIPGQAEHGTAGNWAQGYASSARRKPSRADRGAGVRASRVAAMRDGVRAGHHTKTPRAPGDL